MFKHIMSNRDDEENGEANTAGRSLKIQTSERSQSPSVSQFAAVRRRMMTNLETVYTEERATPHKYLFRRPRALQVGFDGRIIEGGDYGQYDVNRIASENPSQNVSRAITRQTSGDNSSESDEVEERSTDYVEVQRDRLDTFIDLLFVGIVSNISEHYYNQCFVEDQSPAYALLQFALLMAPAWRLWQALQYFINSYYMDDLLQRMLVLWVLALGLIWGNNAPYVLSFSDAASTSDATSRAISSYLIAIVSLKATEAVYSIWLPWIRRQLLVSMIIGGPGTILWFLVIFSDGLRQIYFLVGAIVWDYIEILIMESPIGKRLIGDGLRKTSALNYLAKRFGSFFTIALGEGVFLLIRGSPLGKGFSIQLGRGMLALIIYYTLHWLYFNGDQTRTFVPPAHRRWYIRELWKYMHVPLYACVIMLSSGVLYMVDYTIEGETNGVEEQTDGSAVVTATTAKLQIAESTVGISIGAALLTTTIMALLHRNLDTPKTLLVNNRYLRILPRVLNAIASVLIGLLARIQNPTTFLGIQVCMLMLVMLWEWTAGMERGGGVFEPTILHGNLPHRLKR